MNLDLSPFQLRRPHWRGRNKLIAEELLEPNKSVIDIGCGAKNLLWYYKTASDYLGIDGIDIEEVNIVLDLNSADWVDNVPGGWDYAVNSGILEYVSSPEKLIKQQKSLAKQHIFTWWQGTGHGRMSPDKIQEIIEDSYMLLDKRPWGSQVVFKCEPK